MTFASTFSGGGCADVVLVGNCLESLRTLEDESINCIVTSPPYWGLRSYNGEDGMIGLEKTFDEYLSNIVQVFNECKRVLIKDGTCWLNLGDAYASSSKGTGGKSNKQGSNFGSRYDAKFTSVLPDKNLIGIPWRVAFALQEQGWYLRSDIIWHKPNPMPESVRDRPTKAHEYIFLLTKSPKYWYDADAIREPLKDSSLARLSQDIESQIGSERVEGKTNGNMKAVCFGGTKGNNDNRTYSGNEWKPKRKPLPKANGATDAISVGQASQGRGVGENTGFGANARTVWSIGTAQFKEAHFATFPEEIPMRCILAGCPEGGIVLDPFAGSGTTLAVAKMLGRKYIGIEISEEYAKMTEARLVSTTGSLFNEPV